MIKYWIPETPAGTPLFHLRSTTEDQAWDKLLKEAAHMPYKTKANFQARGYKVLRWDESEIPT